MVTPGESFNAISQRPVDARRHRTVIISNNHPGSDSFHLSQYFDGERRLELVDRHRCYRNIKLIISKTRQIRSIERHKPDIRNPLSVSPLRSITYKLLLYINCRHTMGPPCNINSKGPRSACNIDHPVVWRYSVNHTPPQAAKHRINHCAVENSLPVKTHNE